MGSHFSLVANVRRESVNRSPQGAIRGGFAVSPQNSERFARCACCCGALAAARRERRASSMGAAWDSSPALSPVPWGERSQEAFNCVPGDQQSAPLVNSFGVCDEAEPVDHRGGRSRGATNGARSGARRTRWTWWPAAARTGAWWSRWSPASARVRGRHDRRRRLRRTAAGARSAAKDHRHRRALDGLALLPHRRDRDEHTAPGERPSGLDREGTRRRVRGPTCPSRRVRLPVLRSCATRSSPRTSATRTARSSAGARSTGGSRSASRSPTRSTSRPSHRGETAPSARGSGRSARRTSPPVGSRRSRTSSRRRSR